MAGLRETPLQPIQVESGKLIQPAGSAEEVRNFRRTAEGTLAPVLGPAPLIPNYGSLPAYGNPHGICHARLMRGRRDVTIWHTGPQIQVQDGPTRSRFNLVAQSGGGGQFTATLPDDTSARPPTCFLTTPEGIVIMPHGSRPFFYDGERVAYLGYERPPDAPKADGPGGTDSDALGSIYLIYKEYFGHGRLGTISNDAGNNSRLRGAYQYALRYKDCWGNFSPWSARSNSLTWRKLIPSPDTDPAEDLRVPAIVTNLSRGPDPTAGRDLARSKDLEHAGTSSLFLLPNSVSGTLTGNFATLDDNATSSLVDNAPDTWLVLPVEEADPMPAVLFGCLAFGRAWYVPASDPSKVIYTFPGRWGTPVKGGFVRPDPGGGDIRGLRAFGGILLAWTATTTYVVEPYSSGEGYRTYTLHPRVGCAAPDSIDTLEDGSIVWLGYDGFYRYDGKAVTNLAEPIMRTFDGLNKARLIQATARFDPDSGEYRCWVPEAGQIENTLCLVFDTMTGGWRRRDGEALRAVAVTQDARRMMIGAGYVNSTAGVFALDRRNPDFTEPTRTYRIRTCWFATTGRASPMTVFVHGVEGRTGTVTLNTYRDYRSGAATDNGKSFVMREPGTTAPPTWGTTAFGASSTRWVRSRPIKPKVDIHVASAEAYQVDISSTTPFEFIGLRFGETAYTDHARTERASP